MTLTAKEGKGKQQDVKIYKRTRPLPIDRNHPVVLPICPFEDDHTGESKVEFNPVG